MAEVPEETIERSIRALSFKVVLHCQNTPVREAAKIVQSILAEQLPILADRLTHHDPDIRRAALEEALRPIAKLAADSEWKDVPDEHAADVVYRSEAGGEETVGSITFGELRRLRALSDKGGEHG